MTPLGKLIAQRIETGGPISVADYMADCLMHPQHGYYVTHEPFGTDGDFVTAPEVSQMFGELIGLCLAQTWMNQDRPANFTLAELGPGRGSLMADVLRATKTIPGFHAAANLHLVEASRKLRAQQRETIDRADITFHDSVQTLPDAPLYLVANEFFDALPIRQFIRDKDGWSERQIGLQDNSLAFGLGAATPLAPLEHRLQDTQDGDIVETSAPAQSIIESVTARIGAHGGAALVIDYGDWRSLGDTLQALQGHRQTDPLDEPGQADLTAHVDFEALASVSKCKHTLLTPQGIFLERLGITHRAQVLARYLDDEPLENHIAAHRRLTHPSEMGTLFKTLGFYPEGASPPPGLEP